MTRRLLLLFTLFAACSKPQAAQTPPGIEPTQTTPNPSAPTTPTPTDPRTPTVPGQPPAGPPPPSTVPAGESDPVLYTPDRIHSPINTAIAKRIRGTMSQTSSFAKVGDSISYSWWFMDCFAVPEETDLGAHASLQPSVDYFRPFDRRSVATKVGATAQWPITGAPSPLQQEIEEVRPGVAIVMYGTNDLNSTGTEEGLRAWFWRRYAQSLFTIVDRLLASGAVPIVSSIPYNADHPAQAPVANAILRGIAQTRQIPFVDFYAASASLPDRGLGGDGIHPNVFLRNGAPRGCHLTDEALQYGYNVRNLVSLEALERVRMIQQDGAESLDGNARTPDGEGSLASPFIAGMLPFADARVSAETTYQVDLDAPAGLRAFVLRKGGFDLCGEQDLDCEGGTDTTLRVMTESGAELAQANTVIGRRYTAGTYTFVVQAPATEPTLFVLMKCEAGDVGCQ